MEHAIRTLLLTFSIAINERAEQGYIYIACPPLYKVERGRNHYYCYSDRELTNLVQHGSPVMPTTPSSGSRLG